MAKILIVDDELFNRKLIKEIISDKYEFEEADSGANALLVFREAFLAKKPFDIILLDVAMPEMDGLEVLNSLRKFEEIHGILFGHGVPVIMVTAFREPFMEAFKEGCDDYMLKPIDPEELLAKIESKLKRKN